LKETEEEEEDVDATCQIKHPLLISDNSCDEDDADDHNYSYNE